MNMTKIRRQFNHGIYGHFNFLS